MHRTLSFFFALLILSGCFRKGTNPLEVTKEIEQNIDNGNLSVAKRLADSLKNAFGNDLKIFIEADSLEQIAERIRLDFSVTESQVTKQIEDRYGRASPEEISSWERKGWLEWRKIDGKKMYFNRAASNLMLLRAFHEKEAASYPSESQDPKITFRLHHTEKVLEESWHNERSVNPVNMVITYEITVHPNVVPYGEIVRCWLPWPVDSLPRQSAIKLLKTSYQNYIKSPGSSGHSTIFMEAPAKKDSSLTFSVTWKYTSNGQYFQLSDDKILPYNKTSPEYRKYTSEQPPHIVFTKDIKQLADSIISDNDPPYQKVKKVYKWFKKNIPWTGALEYSIIPNIPEYVCQNRRGDCGMQTLLYMTLLRYKGVPVRWQSGWMVPPHAVNLHDWCEVYFEGVGWVPSDVSYDLQDSDNPLIKFFYMSGIDSYRLIINRGIAAPLYPPKKFIRSEPNDFQRGEVEWDGGNLYFDKWDYNMKIEYVE
jgi:hypothetical protein